jgi:hypothetical protein
MTTRQRATSSKIGDFEEKIFQELAELNRKVDQTNNDIAVLRKELGIEGEHGRLPIVEAKVARLETRVEDLLIERAETHARQRLVVTLISLFAGGLGAAVFTAVLRALGW